jgi:MFS family permease
MPAEPPTDPAAPADLAAASAPSAWEVARDGPVARFLTAQATSTIAIALQAAALGKQVYDITDSEFALGVLGLVEFMPALVLLPLTGSAADRFDRRRLAAASFVIEVAVSVLLFAYALTDPTSAVPLFALALLFGTARAFGSPAMRSIPPLVAPAASLPRLIALYSGTWQFGLIVGPGASGLLYEIDPAVPYLVAALATVLAVVAVTAVRFRFRQERTPVEQKATLHHALEGLRFVRRRPILLGAISLDLAAVLFGGAVALLPAIAEDRLHVGNVGYGWLRAAPGVGAVVISLLLAIRPVRRRVGTSLFAVVAMFGVSTIVLGLTHDYVVAFLALVILASADSVSVFIRATLVPMATPDHMRGRVSAVENVFIGASNEVGAFESGVAATLVGVGPAVVFGGAATLVVVGLWSFLFPSLRRVDTFADAAADRPPHPPIPPITPGGPLLEHELP